MLDNYVVNMPLLDDGYIIHVENVPGGRGETSGTASTSEVDSDHLSDMILSGSFACIGIIVGVLLGALLWRTASHG